MGKQDANQANNFDFAKALEEGLNRLNEYPPYQPSVHRQEIPPHISPEQNDMALASCNYATFFGCYYCPHNGISDYCSKVDSLD